MPKPANWLFILGENHGRHVTGCYGNPVVQTPNLDRVAARGAMFRHAYCSSPICVPARASIATGRFPHQTSFWENSMAYDGSIPSWMRRLRDQGQEVAAIGKLHFRSTKDDNGFTEEIIPMHIVDGVGGLLGLLRGFDEEPIRRGNWDMYVKKLVVGSTPYQAYDRDITRHAIAWLRKHQSRSDRPWALCVNYVSAHPPFEAPESLWDLYPLDAVPLPPAWSKRERPMHPAITHLRTILGSMDDLDEQVLRKVVAGYMAVTTHLDMQIGEVLSVAEDLGMLENTRVLYSSDHGDSCGSHFIFGKFSMYERSVGVPLLMAGPGIPERMVVDQIASHVDLYPTILEGAGVAADAEDSGLPGTSLWAGIQGKAQRRRGFAEYHGLGSKNASYMVRDANDKLVFHVGMPPQLFDLASDPDETTDLSQTPQGVAKVKGLEAQLRSILDPETIDARAKAEQRALAGRFGGPDAIRKRGGIVHTPVPGSAADFIPVSQSDAQQKL